MGSTMLPKVSYLTMMDKYLLLGFVALIVLVFENAFAGSVFRGEDREEKENLMDMIFLVTFSVMWLGVHIIMLFALLFKDFMRVSWEEMNEIDQAEDEEAEFVFAEKENVEGNAESEAAKSEWEYYKKMGVMQRAEAYARKNNIKRTGTFHMKVKEERQRSLEANTVKKPNRCSLRQDLSIRTCLRNWSRCHLLQWMLLNRLLPKRRMNRHHHSLEGHWRCR